MRMTRGSRGQVMALGALTLLVLALMLMLSFNVANAIHEKIRIQQHSDAMAFSMATAEARAMNYFAFSNRSVAATYVSMNTAHAYMSAASLTYPLLSNTQYAFWMIAGLEIGKCCKCKWCSCVSHCIHAGQAIKVANKFRKAAKEYADKVKDQESLFNGMMMLAEGMVAETHFSQIEMYGRTANVLLGNDLDELKERNAPAASALIPSVGLLNNNEFNCALEMPIQLPCIDGPSASSEESRGKVLASVTNAAMPEYAARRRNPMGFMAVPYHLSLFFLADLMTDIQGDGITVPMPGEASGKIAGGTSQSEIEKAGDGNDFKAIGAEDHGNLFFSTVSIFKHADIPGLGFGNYEGLLASDENNGKHEEGRTHSGQHKLGFGLPCLSNGTCFVNFRATDDRDDDFGQPSTYSALTQDLWSLHGKNERGPWKITDDATLTVDMGGDLGPSTLKLEPGEGMALSKALVYYHRFGSWKEHPNLFNPYWRAKLHPFKPQESAKVLAISGATDYAVQALAAPAN